jgi:hypothetical protein
VSSFSWGCSLVCVRWCTLSPGPWGYPRAATLVAPSLVFAGLLHHPFLLQDNHHSSSGSNITMSFPSPGQGPPPPRQIIPTLNNFPPRQIIPTSNSLSPLAPSIPAAPPSSTAKVLKLNSIKDAKAYLDALRIIDFYLRDSNFSPCLVDGALVTTSSNFEASRLWAGQLCLTVKDGKLQFLFKN